MSGRPPYYFTAYGLAVKHGFQGTEEEWLASLQGDNVELRYQDGVLQWKPSSAGEDNWAALFDLGQIQQWAMTCESAWDKAAKCSAEASAAADAAALHSAEASGMVDHVAAKAQEFIQQAEALSRTITTSMVMAYELGSINTSTGADADFSERIRSGYFPVLSGKLKISAPSTVKSRLVFYNGDLSFHSSAGDFSDGSYERSTEAPFARLIVGYTSDDTVADVASLAAMVAVTMPVELSETTQALTVTITGNNADGYTADNDVYDIISADGKRQECVCHWGAVKLPLVRLENEVAYFAAVADGIEYRVEIGPDGVVAVSEELGGNVFDITVAGNDTDGYSADKSYAEIRAAEAVGMVLRCRQESRIMTQVLSADTHLRFGCVSADTGYYVNIAPDKVTVFQKKLSGGGGSGVYVGEEAPTDEDVDVWIDPSGEPDLPQGSDYVLPVATSERLGGVMPVAKTEEMTQSVGVDGLGRLFTAPASGGSEWQLLKTITLENDVTKIEDNLGRTVNELYLIFRVQVSDADGTSAGGYANGTMAIGSTCMQNQKLFYRAKNLCCCYVTKRANIVCAEWILYANNTSGMTGNAPFCGSSVGGEINKFSVFLVDNTLLFKAGGVVEVWYR